MMDIFLECIGWIGAALILAAYLLLSMKKLASDQYMYHCLNIVGSLFFTIYGYSKHASASVLVNLIWMIIGVVAVVNIYRNKVES